MLTGMATELACDLPSKHLWIWYSTVKTSSDKLKHIVFYF